MGDEGDRQIGARRRRMFFSRRAEEQTEWVVGDDTNAGSKDKK